MCRLLHNSNSHRCICIRSWRFLSVEIVKQHLRIMKCEIASHLIAPHVMSQVGGVCSLLHSTNSYQCILLDHERSWQLGLRNWKWGSPSILSVEERERYACRDLAVATMFMLHMPPWCTRPAGPVKKYVNPPRWFETRMDEWALFSHTELSTSVLVGML